MQNLDIAALIGMPIWLLTLVIIWSLAWKGVALWKSARKNHLVWFVIMLIVNTIGILEILYIFVFSEMSMKAKSEQKTFVKKKRR